MTLKQRLDCINQQTLTKSTRSRKKVISTFTNQLVDKVCLVDVVEISLPNGSEMLNSSWKQAVTHGNLNEELLRPIR